jgi:hypothetical protein
MMAGGITAVKKLYIMISPHWTRTLAARASLGRLLTRPSDSPEVERERPEIITALEAEQKVGSATYVDCFKNNENRNGFRTWTGIMSQGVRLFSFFLCYVTV